MKNMYSYKGTRWFKCDLHVHTTASICFKEQDITPEQWVQAAIDKCLDCVAITDHNNGASIDKIKNIAKDTSLVVFPGVEVTCDSSKVHLLIIFDVNKSSEDVRDFLVRAGIRANDFGKQNAATTKSIFDIADLAKEDGAVVIPAHIDEYNGLGSISVQNLEKLYKEYNVDAVQVVHKEFLELDTQVKNNKELRLLLNDYYNQPSPPIDDATISQWITPVKKAIKNNISILTFSDNPRIPSSSKHGIGGIGDKYTWIKMDVNPSLEGLRQAFLLPEYRIRNIFLTPSVPYIEPALWIKSISISKTTITAGDEPLVVEFSPQLNTIIGGRGSGKSSILRFIRGVFNQTSDLTELEEIFKDHSEFYKRVSGKSKKGVLTNESVIEVEFVRNKVLHSITASNIVDSNNQTIQIKKLNEDNIWEVITDEGYIDFFEFDHYSQKQIYEIAQEPNALREHIDSAIVGLEKLNQERSHIKSKFLEKSASIRTMDLLLSEKGKVETRIKDIEESIKKLHESGIAQLLNSKEKFSKENIYIEEFKTAIKGKKNSLNELLLEHSIPEFDLSIFDSEHQNDLEACTEKVNDGLLRIVEKLAELHKEAIRIEEGFDLSINTSQWKQDLEKNMAEFEEKREELEKDGIDVISSFEKLTNEKEELSQKLEEIRVKEMKRGSEFEERKRLQNEYLLICKQVTEMRKKFLRNTVMGDKVKVDVKPFRNKDDFESQFRKCIANDLAHQESIDELMNICFHGVVEKRITKFREIILNIRQNKEIDISLNGRFINLVKSLNAQQIDEIELMLPEDEIEIQYKPNENTPFKSLSTASAGQKTTAILTFILSYGNTPLILDQPEDDLDNRLVFELVVDRIKQAKEKRQLIVVTHNANIPVNGDAEYINSMDSESRFMKVIHEGTVEQDIIKREICQVMEGGEYAFEMRSKRYKPLIK